MNDKPIHDFRPAFETQIGLHPKGYKVFHIGVAFDDNGTRVLHEFAEAQSPDGVHKARVPIAEFDGDTKRASMAACFALAQLMVEADADKMAAPPTPANDDAPEQPN